MIKGVVMNVLRLDGAMSVSHATVWNVIQHGGVMNVMRHHVWSLFVLTATRPPVDHVQRYCLV